jgi:septal ring factor EnvC (AmiA/AmiB activator)
MNRFLLTSLLLGVFGATGFAQEGPTEAEVQLRDQLKSTLVQLRDAQGEIAALQGTQLQNEKQIKTLEAKLAQLEKESTDDSAVAADRIAALEKEVAEQDARNAKQIEALAKWKKSYDGLTEYAQATEAKRADLAGKAVLLQRQNDEYAETNRKLYAVGKEILDRYEGFGLGDAITTREPFVGTTRVKFQNLMQDYSDQLTEQKIRQ